ncbi:MAG TPA: type II toxin-antitoxin system RelE/ParE family toxin [Thermoanaerobaculia bacterium]|jgi:phage-related protein|nr:type II toxin-antitoxin system RelE/ParE family toxin [Thermoanaerobaculia bacterium]
MGKHFVIMGGGLTTPPLSTEARREAGFLLRQLQEGEVVAMPKSRPMPTIGQRCHELRIPAENLTWRIVYYLDDDAVVVLDVFAKKTSSTPKSLIETAKKRLRAYLEAVADS